MKLQKNSDANIGYIVGEFDAPISKLDNKCNLLGYFVEVAGKIPMQILDIFAREFDEPIHKIDNKF